MQHGKDRLMKILLMIVSIVLAIILVGWLGLKIKPASFPTYPSETQDVRTIPLSDGLPAPVERFYLAVYGDQIPVIESAVISGRGHLRVNGITFPARFRFTHRIGSDYRHYIETTVFAQPLMKVNEHYLDGKSRLELPFGVSEGPKVDQGANLALWAEAVWMPSVWVTDSKVRWEARDENSAVLIVPFGEAEERIIVFFDSQTGLLRTMQSMRYKESDSPDKLLWTNDVLKWDNLDGYLIPVDTSVTWSDEGTPWAVFTVEEIIYNSNVDEYIRMTGADR